MSSRLLEDPLFPWQGANPYEQLSERLKKVNHSGVTPSSTAKEINEVLFDLMAAGFVTAEDRLVWDELRHSGQRLLIDFFMYPLPAGDDSAWDVPMRELPLPIQMPDFFRLAAVPPDYGKAISLPPSFELEPDLRLVPVGASDIESQPLDIGAIDYELTVTIGRKHAK